MTFWTQQSWYWYVHTCIYNQENNSNCEWISHMHCQQASSCSIAALLYGKSCWVWSVTVLVWVESAPLAVECPQSWPTHLLTGPALHDVSYSRGRGEIHTHTLHSIIEGKPYIHTQRIHWHTHTFPHILILQSLSSTHLGNGWSRW